MINSSHNSVINLSEITSSYETGLINKLRHFGLDSDFLDTWVPDSDPIKSIVNLADSAAEAKFAEVLEIHVPKEMLSYQQLVSVMDLLPKGLEVEVTKIKTGLNSVLISGFERLQFVEQSETSNRLPVELIAEFPEDGKNSSLIKTKQIKSPSVNSLYDQGSTSKILHRGTLEPKKGFALVEACRDNEAFRVLINCENHTIEAAAFDGVDLGLEGLLDLFCRSIVGLPILEASDHGVARLEFTVRGRSAKRPIQGIVLPSSVDERFSLIQEFIRNVLFEYRKCADFNKTWNDYDYRPGKEWLNFSDKERKIKLDSIFTKTLSELGFSSTEIEVLEIEYDVRVLVRLRGHLAEPEVDKQALLTALEVAMMEKADPRLELYLEPVQDISVLRRLTPEK